MQEVIDSMCSKFPDVTKKQMKDIVLSFPDTVHELTVAHKRVAIKNHIWRLKNRAARTGRNPRTGESIPIPAKDVVAYENTKA